MKNKLTSVLDREWQNNPMDKRPFYNIVLNSINAYASTGTGSNTCSYRFDWSVLPDVPYEVHITYMGEVNNIDDTKLAMVYCDLGVPSNVFEAKITTTAVSSNYLGFMETYLVGANSFLHAEDGTNPPVYFAGRPRNNEFTVRILNNDGQPYTAAGATALGDYLINLRFIQV